MKPQDEELEDYLRGNADVSRAYRQLNHPRVPGEVERKIAAYARDALSDDAGRDRTAPPRMRNLDSPVVRKPSWFAPFSLAASVMLSAAVLLAIAFDPHARVHKDDKLRLVPAVAHRDFMPRQLYTSDPPHSRSLNVDGAQLPPLPVEVLRRDPQEWRARIESLRRSGQWEAADAQMREFRKVFPDYPENSR